MRDKPFNIIRADCPELLEWLKSISRHDEIEKFILPDYKHGISIRFYSRNYEYRIRISSPGMAKDGGEKDTYLGCVVSTRKPRAGEDWNRGNDLADGPYSKETWQKIVNSILAYELVKVVRPPREINK